MKKKLVLAVLLLLAPAWAGAADIPKKDKEIPVVWGEMPAGAKTAYIGIHGGTVPVSLLSSGDGSPMIAVVGLTGNDFLNFMRTNGKLREEPVLPEFPAPQFSPEPETKLVPTTATIVDGQISVATTRGTTTTESPDPQPSDLPATSAVPTASANAPAAQIAEIGTIPPSANATQPADTTTELAATTPPTPAHGVNATLLLAGAPDGDIPVIYATGRTFERMSLIPENWAPFGLTEKALSLEGEIKILAAPKKMPRNGRKSSKK